LDASIPIVDCACRRAPFSFGPERKRLLLEVRFDHTRAKVAALLKKAGRAVETAQNVISFELDASETEPVLEQIGAGVTAAERDAIRALIVDAAGTPSIGDYLHADSLTRITSRVKSNWLIESIARGETRSFFQPIFDARTGAIFAHEALLRVPKDGAYVGPGEAFSSSMDQDLSQYLDRVARETAIECAARAGIASKIFINFLPSAIYDPRTCLRTTVDALDKHGIAHDRIVFEVVESDRVHNPEHLRTIIDYYRAGGFQVALDDLGSGYSSFTLINQLHPDFVKLDMSLVQNVDRDPYKAVLAVRLVQAVKELGIKVIAEGIEREEELAWAKEQAIDYVQGYLLGRPLAESA
jgi:EAL domain-containing protein (putative c-di-GMP-specific phosphodiesterase class I)